MRCFVATPAVSGQSLQNLGLSRARRRRVSTATADFDAGTPEGAGYVLQPTHGVWTRDSRISYISAMSTPAAIPAAGKTIQLSATKKNGFAEKNFVLYETPAPNTAVFWTIVLAMGIPTSVDASTRTADVSMEDIALE